VLNFPKLRQLLPLGALALGACHGAAASVPGAIDAWRDQVAQTRRLAENDVPQSYARAQQLLGHIPAGATPADQVRALNLLARAEANLAHTADAERHARQARELAERDGDRVGQAEAELNLFFTAVYSARIGDMLAAAKRSVELLKGVNRPDLLGESLLRMAMMYHRYDMMQQAMEMAMQSMDIARSSRDPLALMYAYKGLAFAYRSGGHYKLAAENYAAMREQARRAGSRLQEADAILGLAVEQARLGDLGMAERQVRESLALVRSVGAPFDQNGALYTLADLLRRQGRYQAAQPILDDMLALNERYQSPLSQWYALLARSSNYQDQGKLAAARADAERAFALAKRIGIPLYLGESMKRLAAIAAAGGDPERAYALSLQAGEMAARASREKLGTQTLELAERYKAESKQREIDELTRRNRAQSDELQVRALQQRWLWTVAGASGIGAAGLAYFLLRLRRSKQEIDLLNASLELRVQERTAELRQQTRYMRTLFDMLPLWVWLKDTEGRFLSANQPNAEAHGQTVEAMIGLTDHDLWPHLRADLLRADELDVMRSRERKIVEREELLPGAMEKTWMQTYHAPVLDEDGTVLGTVGVARNISDIRRSLRVEAARARVFECLAQGRALDEVLAQVAAYVETANPALRCVISRRQDGDEAPAEVADASGDWLEAVRNPAGEVLGHIAIGRSAPAAPSAEERELVAHAGHLAAIAIGRKRIEEQLQHQAAYDALTGLPNRRMFSDRLREEIARASRHDGALAVMFIDLDHFKEVNDTLGHQIGDCLLVEVARRLRGLVRASDVVARLGGDEFVVVLPECGDAQQLGELAQGVLDAVRAPLSLGGQTVYVSASLGIATYPADAESMDQLITYADRAMYAAKEEGRNGFRFFTLPMYQQARSRMLLTNELRLALDRGELQVWLQPIVDLASGRVAKAEALLRWQHPVRGMVPPDVFIPIAEETGLIVEIGDWVFRQAAAAAKRWLDQRGGAPCQVSINVSPRQFSHGVPADHWIGILQQLGLPAHSVVIEITEGLLLADRAGIMDKLAHLRAAGMELALDDFGTGYSAMAYLKKFNIDYLKIDRSFVRDLDTDPSDRAIAEAIVVMARKLGLKTIAEGVETPEQRNLLASVGCDMVQGYLYARPLPATEFLAAQAAVAA
jgi:diguanylate cyclase (GGDEF)-like protein/PAS domain S-box-containing protein